MKKRLSCLLLMLTAVLLASSALAACPTEDAHRYGHWKPKTTASCTRQGHEFRYCTKCDHWEQRRTSKLPHTPGEKTVTKPATCTEKGKEEAICQVCNNVVRYTIPMLEHNYGEMQVIKEPTCTENGTGEYVCVDCGAKKRARIEKLGHDFGEMNVTKEPTCKKAGAGEQTCQRCAAVRKSTIAKLEHAWGEWNVTREPQGKRKGVRTGVCAMCGLERQEHFYWEGTLYEGMAACEEVIRMQEKLRDLGLYKGSIRSGQFGEMTTSAVAKFQKSVGLEGTGIADADTLGALDIAWEKATGKSAAPALDPQEMAAAEQAQPIAE